jgi:hypothetical protein
MLERSFPESYELRINLVTLSYVGFYARITVEINELRLEPSSPPHISLKLGLILMPNLP